METRAFKPNYGPTTGTTQGTLQPSVTVSASTSAAASAAFSGSNSSPFVQIRVANTTNGWAYINFGNLQVAVVTAATVATGLPVAPGAVEIFTVDNEVNGASVILSAGATTGPVTFTRGEGL